MAENIEQQQLSGNGRNFRLDVVPRHPLAQAVRDISNLPLEAV